VLVLILELRLDIFKTSDGY